MADVAGPQSLRQLLDAVLTIGSDLDLPLMLERIVQSAVDLVDATYGALGVLDDTGTRLAEFITVGIDAETHQRIGRLPEGHGILGLLILDAKPLRLPDLTAHPESYGFPPHHPPMRSFLGVPIRLRDQVFGNLYLTDKLSAEEFTEIDEDLTTVIQRLFATGLFLQATERRAEQQSVASRIQTAVEDLDETIRQVRTSIFALSAASRTGSGLRSRVLDVVSELVSALASDPVLQFAGPVDAAIPDELADSVVAVVREALSNVARHARAKRVDVRVAVVGGDVVVRVSDDGIGVQSGAGGGSGLGNLTARAVAAGGEFMIGPGRMAGRARTLMAIRPRFVCVSSRRHSVLPSTSSSDRSTSTAELMCRPRRPRPVRWRTPRRRPTPSARRRSRCRRP
jgi:GAF domain-containing protein